MKIVLKFLAGTIFLIACNKSVNQLPVITAEPYEMIVPVSVSGVETIEVHFSQITETDHDTVWVSVRNISGKYIERVVLMLELCNATPHNFDNCYLQTAITINGLGVDSIRRNVLILPDKNLDFDSSMINVALLSLKYDVNDTSDHRFAGIYSKGLLRFIDTTIIASDSTYDIDTLGNDTTIVVYDTTRSLKYFGDIRGYVSTEGYFVFRIKAAGPTLYNATGRFDGLDTISNGRLSMNELVENVIKTPPWQGGQQVIHLNNGQLTFGIYLEKPLEIGSVDSISVNVIRH